MIFVIFFGKEKEKIQISEIQCGDSRTGLRSTFLICRFYAISGSIKVAG